MAGRGSMPGERRGGRKAGTPNKVTADVRAAAAIHGPGCIKTLVEIKDNTEAPPAARVAACKEILDRWAGKAPQALTDADGRNLPSIPQVINFIMRQQDGAINRT